MECAPDFEAPDKILRLLALIAAELKHEQFRADILKIADTCAPMLPRKRLNWDVAKTIFRCGKKVPALVFNKNRMEKRKKQHIFAADLLIPHVLNRSRHGLPKALFDLCQELDREDASPLREISAKTFRKATGFAIK